MTRFKLDVNEFELIDKYPTKTQTRYGRPDPKDVVIKYKRIPLADHLKKINSIYTKANEVEKKISKPKNVVNVKKSSVPFIV